MPGSITQLYKTKSRYWINNDSSFQNKEMDCLCLYDRFKISIKVTCPHWPSLILGQSNIWSTTLILYLPKRLQNAAREMQRSYVNQREQPKEL